MYRYWVTVALIGPNAGQGFYLNRFISFEVVVYFIVDHSQEVMRLHEYACLQNPTGEYLTMDNSHLISFSKLDG